MKRWPYESWTCGKQYRYNVANAMQTNCINSTERSIVCSIANSKTMVTCPGFIHLLSSCDKYHEKFYTGCKGRLVAYSERPLQWHDMVAGRRRIRVVVYDRSGRRCHTQRHQTILYKKRELPLPQRPFAVVNGVADDNNRLVMVEWRELQSRTVGQMVVRQWESFVTELREQPMPFLPFPHTCLSVVLIPRLSLPIVGNILQSVFSTKQRVVADWTTPVCRKYDDKLQQLVQLVSQGCLRWVRECQSQPSGGLLLPKRVLYQETVFRGHRRQTA